jgi:hypothetical protein
MAAVILRKKLPNSEPILLTTLSEQLQASIKSEVALLA